MYEGRVKILQPNELPGAAVYNDLARAIRHARPGSDFILQYISASGGLVTDINISRLKRELGGLDASFTATVSGSYLTIAAGMVWLVDRKLAVSKYEDKKLIGDWVAWVEIKKSAAVIKAAKKYPDFVDTKNKLVNWPLAEIRLVSKRYTVFTRHLGDIMIPTMPHVMIDGYDGSQMMTRMLVDGVEKYLPLGECNKKEQA